MKIMKYEYLTKQLGGDLAGLDLDMMLNKYSDEGWELFHVSNILGWENTLTRDDDHYLLQQFIFRRPKSEK